MASYDGSCDHDYRSTRVPVSAGPLSNLGGVQVLGFVQTPLQRASNVDWPDIELHVLPLSPASDGGVIRTMTGMSDEVTGWSTTVPQKIFVRHGGQAVLVSQGEEKRHRNGYHVPASL